MRLIAGVRCRIKSGMTGEGEMPERGPHPGEVVLANLIRHCGLDPQSTRIPILCAGEMPDRVRHDG